MSAAAIRLAVQLSRELPAADVRTLARAVRQGTSGLQALLADAAGVAVRAACQRLLATGLSDDERYLVAGALLGALEPDPRIGALDVVWTGPASAVATGRLTSAVVVDLIDQAQAEVLLVGYAVHSEASVAVALERAQQRNVAITLLFERHADNPDYAGTGNAFPHLEATRLAWPKAARATGASLHAKVLVVDGSAALIGSANLTGAALERNLECGLLVKGGSTPREIASHIHSLCKLGMLRPLAQGA